MGECDQAKFERLAALPCLTVERGVNKRYRKLIDCALQGGDIQLARETFAIMSEKGKLNPLTQYLMYKVSLKDGDEEFGAKDIALVVIRLLNILM
jgi:hypothetical protein